MADLQSPITQSDLDYARSLANQGRLSEMYDFFAAKGDRYAVLAKGVVEDNTVSGSAALDFMENVAERNGRTLTESDINDVRQGMANGYLGTLQSIINNPANGGVVTREIRADEAQAFHNSVFNNTGLGSGAWTLSVPFELLGPEGAQNYWDHILSDAGDPIAEATSGNAMRNFFQGWEPIASAEQAQLMKEWLDNTGQPGFMGDAARGGASELFNNIMEGLRDLFSEAETTYSPIILDLDGDGVETLNISAGANFDLNSNGFAERTGWVGVDDGLLVWDRNGDGTIDNGTELFGNETLMSNGSKAGNGFLALSELDTNADGRVDTNDAGWSNLRVWRDANSDGVSSAQEMLTLDVVGVQSIGTSYSNQNVLDAAGNYHKQVGGFTRTDGTTGTATDVWFNTDQMYTVALDTVTIPTDIAALPDIQGFGNVCSLHQAMARDASGELKALVESFATLTTMAERDSVMEEILFKWTGVEGIDPNSRGGAFDARRLTALERFLGEGFAGLTGSNPGGGPSAVLAEAYQGLSDFMRAQLTTQTALRSYYDLVAFTWNDATHAMEGDLSAVADVIQTQLDVDPMGGRLILGEFSRSIQDLGLQASTSYAMFRESFAAASDELGRIVDTGGKSLIMSTPGDDTLVVSATGAIIYTGGGNDTVQVLSAGTHTINTGAGNDTITVAYDSRNTIYGEDGDDVLQSDRAGTTSEGANYGNTFIGGRGNDRMVGWHGEDTYIFNRGDGQDVINDSSSYSTKIDTLRFGAGITVEDLRVYGSGSHLVISINDPVNPLSADQITIENWWNSTWVTRIESFVFEDGSTLDINGMNLLAFTGTEGADTLIQWGYSSNGNDSLTINGLGGDDTIQTRRLTAGTHTVYGGAGNDTVTVAYDSRNTIYGEDGDDVLQSDRLGTTGQSAPYGNTFIGGRGNDRLVGHAGADTYIFNRGDGQDVINDYSTDSTKTDALRFGPGMSASDLSAYRSGNHIVIKINDPLNPNATDQITIENWVSSTYMYRIDAFIFEDGAILGIEDINRLALTGADGADSITGWSGENLTYTGLGGDDIIQASTGNDILNGGDGADTLYGGAGTDALVGGLGDDLLYGGEGDDTYVLNLGDRYDFIGDTSGTDKIVFGTGIAFGDVRPLLSGGQLYLMNQNGFGYNQYGYADSVVIGEWNSTPVIENFVFEDVGQVSAATLLAPRWSTSYDAEMGQWSVTIYTSSGYVLTTAGGSTNGEISGSSEDDLLVVSGYAIGGDGNDAIYGLGGDDRLDGGGGADTLSGGRGNDTYFVDNVGDVVVEGGVDGMDVVNSMISYALTANVENLILAGADATSGTGNTGNNMLDGSVNTSANVLAGGLGDDVVENANEGTDTVYAGLSYALTANVERLMLTGADAISGTGNAGNNTLDGSLNTAANMLAGGLGDDVYIVGAGDTVVEYADEGTDTVYAALSYILGDNVENLTLTSGANDTAKGNSLNNRLEGNAGNNDLSGRAGDDYLSAMDGDDTLNGGSGADEMLGGQGNDTYYVENVSDVVVELVDQGTDTIDSLVSYTLAENVEILRLSGEASVNGIGNDLDNALRGNAAANILMGAAGDDDLNGRWGDDTLFGGAGNDFLNGGQGSDTYRFSRGDGVDTVSDYDAMDADPAVYGATLDSVRLDGDIAHDQLWFTRSGHDLQIGVIGTADQMTLQGWYRGEAYQVDEIYAGDNYHLMNEQVEQLVQAMAAFAPPSGGELDLPASYRPDIDPVIAVSWQAA